MRLITFEHLYSMPGQGVRPGWCHKGARAFCRRHGLDWLRIVRDGGISAQELAATGDALALALIAHARAAEEING